MEQDSQEAQKDPALRPVSEEEHTGTGDPSSGPGPSADSAEGLGRPGPGRSFSGRETVT